MKKTIVALLVILAVSGCKSISAEGEYGSITLKNKDQSYSKTNSKTKKSNGNAYGHKNPKNPHYKSY